MFLHHRFKKGPGSGLLFKKKDNEKTRTKLFKAYETTKHNKYSALHKSYVCFSFIKSIHFITFTVP